MKKRALKTVEENTTVEPAVENKPQGFQVNRYWVLFGGGIILALTGIGLLFIWFSMPFSAMQQVVGGITLLTLGSGVYLVRRQLKNRNNRYGGAMVVTPSSTSQIPSKSNGYANSLCIYPDKLIFDNVNEPPGQPQKVLNDGRYYYVLKWNQEINRLEPFILPDSHYTDPSILARYLGLPAQYKYLQNRETLWKFAGPGLLLIGNIAAFIAIIALSG